MRWELRTAPALVLAVVALSGSQALAAPGDFRLVFTTDHEGIGNITPPPAGEGFGLWTMRADGSAAKRLTTPLAHSDGDFHPSWSSDGSRVAFRRGLPSFRWNIYTMNEDGSGLRNLTSDQWQNEDPEWSPDGSMIAYEAVSGGSGVVIVDAEAGTAVDPIRVMRDGRDAAWSPDGSEIAWVDSYAGIVFSNLEGSAGGTVDVPLEASDLAWSPDGREIAFAGKDFALSPDPRPDIYIVSIEDGATRQLTSTPTDLELAPSWSPDGRRLAFAAAPYSYPATPTDIHVMNADGSNRVNITNSAAWDATPDWGIEPYPRPSSPAISQPVSDRTAPNISRLSLTHTTFRVGPTATAARRKRIRIGTSFRFTSSEPASVAFSFEKVRARNSCRTRTNRRRCRFRSVGKLRYPARAGSNRQPFYGWIGRQALRPGRYRVGLQAIDASGNRSLRRTIRFRVARP